MGKLDEHKVSVTLNHIKRNWGAFMIDVCTSLGIIITLIIITGREKANSIAAMND